jgi:hypothetical protein
MSHSSQIYPGVSVKTLEKYGFTMEKHPEHNSPLLKVWVTRKQLDEHYKGSPFEKLMTDGIVDGFQYLHADDMEEVGYYTRYGGNAYACDLMWHICKEQNIHIIGEDGVSEIYDEFRCAVLEYWGVENDYDNDDLQDAILEMDIDWGEMIEWYFEENKNPKSPVFIQYEDFTKEFLVDSNN